MIILIVALETKLQRVTVEQYLDVLICLSIVAKLAAWTSGEAKREVKDLIYSATSATSAPTRRLKTAQVAVERAA